MSYNNDGKWVILDASELLNMMLIPRIVVELIFIKKLDTNLK